MKLELTTLPRSKILSCANLTHSCANLTHGVVSVGSVICCSVSRAVLVVSYAIVVVDDIVRSAGLSLTMYVQQGAAAAASAS